MADFCKQCSEEIFGEDLGDMKGLGEERELPPSWRMRNAIPTATTPSFGWEVLCEGCGFTLVDDEGKCIFAGCSKHGAKEKGD